MRWVVSCNTFLASSNLPIEAKKKKKKKNKDKNVNMLDFFYQHGFTNLHRPVVWPFSRLGWLEFCSSESQVSYLPLPYQHLQSKENYSECWTLFQKGSVIYLNLNKPVLSSISGHSTVSRADVMTLK